MTATIDIVKNPNNPGTEHLLDLPQGGTIVLYGERTGSPLLVRITSLKREGDAPGHFILEGFARLADAPEGSDEVRVESSFYNANTGQGTLHVSDDFAARYRAVLDAEPQLMPVPRGR